MLLAFFIQKLLRHRLDRASEEFHSKPTTNGDKTGAFAPAQV